MLTFYFIIYVIVILLLIAELFFSNSYKCVNHTCVTKKMLSTEKKNSGLDGSIDVCRLTCGSYGSLWPRPTISTTIR